MTLSAIAFRRQLDTIKRNPLVFTALAVTAIAILYTGYPHHKTPKIIVYLITMWLCTFLTDIIILWQEDKKEAFPVRQSVREAIYFLGCIVLGYAFLVVRLDMLDWNATPRLAKLAMMPFFIFVYPIGLALIMLLLKYKPRELGFRYPLAFLTAIPLIIIIATASFIIAPKNIVWRQAYEMHGGIPGLLVLGFLVAALPEEFLRLVGQTRLGALLKNKAAGWFLATIIWAFMHVPGWYTDGKDLWQDLVNAVKIIPYGLMLGYLTHRTKSIFPAMLIHGTNMWGLQVF